MVAMQAPSDVSGAALPDYRTQPRAFLQALFHAAVRSAQPLNGMRAWLPEPPRGRTLVLGAGKAGGSMAQALEALWPPEAPLSGLVVTRYGHGHPTRHVEVAESAHPVPDEAGARAARRMLDLAADAGEGDLVLFLVSGGGSSLTTLPAPGLCPLASA